MLPLQLKSAATDGDVNRLAKQLGRLRASERDEEGNTPLHYSAWGGAIGLCRQFMDQKADIGARNNSAQTPLHLAAQYGRYDVVTYLLDAGADLAAVDKIRYTPLHMAAEANWGVTGWEGSGGKNNRNADVCRLLIQRGADPTAIDSFQRTPLDVSSSSEEIKTILKQAIQQKKKLLEEANRKQVLQGRTDRASSGAPSTPSEGAPSEQSLVKGPTDWTNQDLQAWLENIGLPRYAPVFAEKAITGKYLVTKMTEEKLALIVADEFHRERIWDEIETLKKFDSGEEAARRREEQARMRRAEEEAQRQREEERREEEERKQKRMRSLKSKESSTPTRITFENNLDVDVRLLWVDFNGEAHLKRFLTQHETHTEDTFEGHVWQVINDRTGVLLRAEIATADPLWVHAQDQPLYDDSSLPSYSQISN